MKTKVTTASWNEEVARQFPCIASACKVEYLTERAKVAVLDVTLLETIPSEEEGTEASGYSTTDRIEFWSLTHEQIGHHVRVELSCNEPRDDHDGETVGDALAALGDEAKNVRFVTRVRAVDVGVIGNETDSVGVTVYRVAEFDLTGWLAAREAAARGAVKAVVEAPAAGSAQAIKHLEECSETALCDVVQGLSPWATARLRELLEPATTEDNWRVRREAAARKDAGALPQSAATPQIAPTNLSALLLEMQGHPGVWYALAEGNDYGRKGFYRPAEGDAPPPTAEEVAGRLMMLPEWESGRGGETIEPKGQFLRYSTMSLRMAENPRGQR